MPFVHRRARSAPLVVLRLSWWLERVSRRFLTPSGPKTPVARFHQVRETRTLSLEQPVYAARKPPREYVFIPEDEYFHRVERVLEQV